MTDPAIELIGQVEVDGSYVLASAPRDQVSLILPSEEHTAFTGRLLRLFHEGVPGGPELLTIDNIYQQLRAQMKAEGLPQPHKRGTDNANLLALARNRAFAAAAAGDPQEGAAQLRKRLAEQTRILGPDYPSRAGQKVSEQVGMDHRRVMLIVRDGERLAWSITAAGVKAIALAEIAQAVAASDPDRAARLIDDATRVVRNYSPPKDRSTRLVPDRDPKRSFREGVLPRIATIVATWNPGEAERIAASIRRSKSSRGRALAAIAHELAASDPDRAERLAESITDQRHKATALAGIAQALAASDPERAARLIDDAEQVVQAAKAAGLISFGRWEADEAVTTIAAVLATSDPDRAEQAVALSIHSQCKARALAGVTQVLATSDPDRAERLAESITDQRHKATALAGIAQALAASDPERAARLVNDAEEVAQSISGKRWQEDQASALSSIAQFLSTSDPDRAERLAESITDQRHKATALAGIAQALAASDPERAERIARSITIPELQVSALTGIARKGLQSG